MSSPYDVRGRAAGHSERDHSTLHEDIAIVPVVGQEPKPARTLPPPIVTPLDPRHVWLALPATARALFDEAAGDEPVYHMVRSSTRVDVGYWLRNVRAWALCLRDELLLLAPGRRPLAQRIPYTQIRHSTYSQMTGELLLIADKPLPVKALGMPPLEAMQILAQVTQRK